MSVSLIGRQLGALRLAQRATAPVMSASASRASPVAASTASVTSSTHHVCPAPFLGGQYLQQPINIDTVRFSSTMENSLSTDDINKQIAALDDDGGPVSSIPQFKDMTNEQLADTSTIPGYNLIKNPPRRNTPRGALVGKVVSDKMQKTVNVAVDRFKIIPKYHKRWRFTRKFMAHDEHEVCNVGDLVMIVPCQKISRHKHFMVREIIRPKGQL